MVPLAVMAFLGLLDLTRATWQTSSWWFSLSMAWVGYAGLVWLAWRNRRSEP